MRLVILAVLIAPILLAACGATSEERTVVVRPQPGQTVVVAPPAERDASHSRGWGYR